MLHLPSHKSAHFKRNVSEADCTHHFGDDISTNAAALPELEPVALRVVGHTCARLRHKLPQYRLLAVAAHKAACVPGAAKRRHISAPAAVCWPTTAAAQIWIHS